MATKEVWGRLRHGLNIIIIIAGILYLVSLAVSAPLTNPYDNYDLITYNCLDIALETQEWYLVNGIETTVMIGLFNDSMGHAWLEDTKGTIILGFVPQWNYEEIYTLNEFNGMYN